MDSPSRVDSARRVESPRRVEKKHCVYMDSSSRVDPARRVDPPRRVEKKHWVYICVYITISTRVDSFSIDMENDPLSDSSRRVDSFGSNGSTRLAESKNLLGVIFLLT